MLSKEMKDSGVEWIGKIPMDWDTRRLKVALYRVKEIVDRYNGENILSLTMNGVVVRDLVNPKGKMPTTFDGYQKISKGNIITCLFDIDVTPRCVGIAYDDGLTSPAYTQYQIYKKFDVNFIYYYLLMLDNDKIIVPITKSLRNTIKSEDFLDLKFSFPTKERQIRISKFLADSIKKINTILSESQQSIDELKKYKQSIITKAVTKGLDENVEMKDSGIEFIGYIPHNWTLNRLKQILKTQLLYGANESGIYYNDDLPRYIRITDILDNNILSSENKLSLTREKAEPYLLAEGDILFARSGASVGKTFLVGKDNVGDTFAGYLIKAQLKSSIIPKFIYYYTLSGSFENWKNSITIQATIQNIGAEKYRNLPIPIPTKKIQQEIVSYLDIQTKKVDNLIQNKKTIINELEKYKKSLIYEYVTGKKEV
ncbi:restriction endonuclease subunit S [Paucisalibacillus globulus]|uniref:restriction endonuclease subunit S n=1 Tax=Paucisalibacillus globulus TaxID=351095 RepID=UPI001C3ED2ED|nr:restriction endonuclease subunit S [Paucisalibacillus globulus]